MNIQMPEKVSFIINRLEDNGYEAYAVGGCVRDAILGRNPDDWDITTSAKPMEVKALFKRTIDTGIQHGTVTVMIERDGFEVTTYRIDGEYEDNRHPKSVEFTSNLEEDLKRRDFTINAMAYNDRIGLVDKFGGFEDINNKIIRCVGNPHERFSEDALRILRAVRFSAQLGFEIEENTKKAVIEKTNNLKDISAERIRVEFNKLLMSDNPDKIFIAYDTGITRAVLSEFDMMVETQQENPHHIYNVGRHSVKSIEMLEKKDLVLCWTMLLHDVGKPVAKTVDETGKAHFYGHAEKSSIIAEDILKRLKFDNYTINKVKNLVKWHDYEFSLSQGGIRRAVNKIGEDIIEDLFVVKKADIMAQNPDMAEEKLEHLKIAKKIYNEVKSAGDCVSLKMLSLNGNDLIKIGIKPGKEMGETLNKLLEIVLENPELNNKEYLIDIVKKEILKM